ncbi:histone-like nucleoid-structuring protein Lsr2 [Corynebacterium comes]|uniref:Nucleoid-associated protein Lsr2 n=1 Tax=Corynebacterium comes TaxID=2675218 RepID=A0A6B8VWN4_9CORY|nr:Lsr2 family protein [Corynebacterium comes]QGU05754.1 Nucleoid-associated protein Lsr2 [Corynebacterium comes]
MARRDITQYFDDLDNSALEDSEVNSIRFSVDGSHYILDLSDENAAAFRSALEPWIAAAQPAPTSTPQRSTTRQTSSMKRSRAVREWARKEGLEVSDRGKIPARIMDAYDKAQGK